jgi:hypothetical protein
MIRIEISADTAPEFQLHIAQLAKVFNVPEGFEKLHEGPAPTDPETVYQVSMSVKSPNQKKRGRKPGSKNKSTTQDRISEDTISKDTKSSASTNAEANTMKSPPVLSPEGAKTENEMHHRDNSSKEEPVGVVPDQIAAVKVVPAESAPSVDKSQVMASLKKVADKFGEPGIGFVRDIFSRFGVYKLGDLKVTDYPDVVKMAENVLLSGCL